MRFKIFKIGIVIIAILPIFICVIYVLGLMGAFDTRHKKDVKTHLKEVHNIENAQIQLIADDENEVISVLDGATGRVWRVYDVLSQQQFFAYEVALSGPWESNVVYCNFKDIKLIDLMDSYMGSKDYIYLKIDEAGLIRTATLYIEYDSVDRYICSYTELVELCEYLSKNEFVYDKCTAYFNLDTEKANNSDLYVTFSTTQEGLKEFETHMIRRAIIYEKWDFLDGIDRNTIENAVQNINHNGRLLIDIFNEHFK